MLFVGISVCLMGYRVRKNLVGFPEAIWIIFTIWLGHSDNCAYSHLLVSVVIFSQGCVKPRYYVYTNTRIFGI